MYETLREGLCGGHVCIHLLLYKNIIILLPTPFKLDKTELPRLLYISLGCCKYAIELRLGECRYRISVSDRSLPLEAFHVFQCVL